jgi:hypothetical protein
MLTNTSDEHTLRNPEFNYPITVKWGAGSDTLTYWDNICIYAIEQFGLPGERYVTDISADNMSWIFRSEQDALIFKLRFSEVTD